MASQKENKTVTNAQLLEEVNQLLRTMPAFEELRFGKRDALQWIGAANAVIKMWDGMRAIQLQNALGALNAYGGDGNYHAALSIIYEAQYSLRLREGATNAVAVAKGEPFDYFNGVRKIIEQAHHNLLIVDPWMGAEFAESYLPQIPEGVDVRLLTSANKLGKLLAALGPFVEQYGRRVQVREHADLHGRFMLVDGRSLYQSDASFKDGGKNADAVVMAVVDFFDVIRDRLEQRWTEGVVRI